MTEARELAVVVGATGAFGQAIVDRLAAAGLGVVAVARSADSLAALGERVPGLIACAADIASDASVETIAAALDRPVRMIVHGPGVGVAGGILSAPTATLVDAVAIGGHYGFEPTAYAAAAGVANAALMNAVRQLSLAYGPRGVTAHLIAPGPADTERLRRVAADRAALRGIAVDEVLADMLADSSIGRFTTPGQVAWAVAILLAPEADAMTGSSLMLDSGRRRGLP
jgi:NAD(P)-dependent dehydrogenase (short-subunit alcohol dehydrogenase family)